MMIERRTFSKHIALVATIFLAACGNPAEAPVSDAIESEARAEATPPLAQQRDVVEVVDLSSLPAPFNEANYEAGKRVFRTCATCHTFQEGVHLTGPSLHRIMGAEVGAVQGFGYSEALQNAELTWTTEIMDLWLEQPGRLIPGNTMNYAGLRRESQRRDLIAYMLIEADGSTE